MAKSDPKKLKAGLDYLDDLIRTAYGTHNLSVDDFTKYTKADAVKHARQGISKLGIQSGAKEGGKRVVNIITEAAEGYIRDTVTGKPTKTGGSYIHVDDVKAALKAQVDEGFSFAKSQKKLGLEMGKTIGKISGAQVARTAAADAAPALVKQGIKVGLKQGAKAMFGPAAIGGMVAWEAVSKGYDRAKSNPEFHRGKAGKSYLDLSVKTPGKYGVDY